MNEDRFWLLVSLKLSGEARSEEIAELQMLLQQNPQLAQQADALHSLWRSSVETPAERKESAFNRHMQRLSNHFAEPVLQYEHDIPVEESDNVVPMRQVSYRRLWWVTGIAASLFVCWFFILYLPSKKVGEPLTARNTVSTKRGSKSKIQLPDGTQVWLNADSKITYNEKFQGTLREVQLSGEAFFDVVRDESRPFVIHTSAIDLKVLGTSFNVRSYEDEKNTETSLIHGSVEITLKNNPDKKIILKPNEKLIVNNSILHASKEDAIQGNMRPVLTLGKINYEKKDSSVIETSWVRNRLAFDGEAFEDVALKIERWFDVKVHITDDSLKKEPFSGVFDDESLQVVMEALQLTGKFRYTINRKDVTVGH